MPAAAHKTHPHTCTKILHPGGPIVSGSPMVQTTGLPSTRLVDRAACSGPDPIAQGSTTVLIDGLPASRLGDKSSHGGVIFVGEPSVLIGGPTVTIRVEGDEAFMNDVQTALAKLLKTRSGLEWMRQMAQNGHTVTIVRTDEQNGYCKPDSDADAKNGKGTDSTIEWNPDLNRFGGFPGPAPGSEVILAHEMCHALHDANGNNRNGPDDNFPPQEGTSSRNEERSTVGTRGPVRQPNGTQETNPRDYSRDVPTENSFRDDLGKPRRPSYYPRNFPGGAPW